MKIKRAFSCLLIIPAFFFCPLAWAKTTTLTTYYPAPQGEYDNLTVSGTLTAANFNMTGSVGIGTTVPATKLEVTQDSAIKIGHAYMSSQLTPVAIADFGLNAWNNGNWTIPDLTNGSAVLRMYANKLTPPDNFFSFAFRAPGAAAQNSFTQVARIASDTTADSIKGLEVAQNYAIKLGHAYVSSGTTETAQFGFNGWQDGSGTPAVGWQMPDPAKGSALMQIWNWNKIRFLFLPPNGTPSQWVETLKITTGGIGIFNPADPGGSIDAYFGPSRFILQGDGNAVVYKNGAAIWNSNSGGSSIRWKENIRPVDNALDKISRLQGVYFDWKKDHANLLTGNGKGLGFIAEDVGKIFPEIVSYENDGSGNAAALDYDKLTAVLVEAVKELKAENNSLQARIEALETKLNK